MDYALAVVRAAVKPGRLSTLTFHDWIVTGGNRIALLDEALAEGRKRGAVISTIARHPEWLSGAA